jgi:tetratricopeptide (TPR) repeat protein
MAARLKAYVSSTFEDLKGHRARVLDALHGFAIATLASEYMGATPGPPEEQIRDSVAACDLFILLVAFRRGYVPPGEELSMTQLEYRAALDAGIDVFVLMLDENAPWLRRFDELDSDPEIRRFRSELLQNHAVLFFDLEPSSLDIKPSITRWLQGRTERSEVSDARAIATLRQLSDYTSTDELTEKLRRLEPDIQSIVDDVPGIVPSVLEAYRNAVDWDGLIDFVDNLDGSFLNNPAVVKHYALALSRRGSPGDLDRSIRLTEEVVENHPDNPDAYSILGGRYWDRWRESSDPSSLDQAISAYDSAAHLDPTNWYAKFQSVLLRRGRRDDPELLRSLASSARESLSNTNNGRPHEAWTFLEIVSDLQLAAVAEDWNSVEHLSELARNKTDDPWLLETARESVKHLLVSGPHEVAEKVERQLRDAEDLVDV